LEKYRARGRIPNFPNPLPREDYITIKCKIYNIVKNYNLDMLHDMFTKMLENKLPKDRSADTGGLPEIINQMMNDWRKAKEKWPKDDDCDQEPPAPRPRRSPGWSSSPAPSP
jgi:hypothetical protein